MRYINEFREGELVRDIYLCKSVQTLTAKTGKNYMSLKLQDKTGMIDGKIWELNNGISHFEALDYILIDAQVSSFQGAAQLNIKRVRKADPGEYDIADYMPVSDKDINVMFTELIALIDSVGNLNYHRLLRKFFAEDPDFITEFKRHSAAKCVHHGFVGGLLEHTLSVAKLCDHIAGAYPIINRDLLLTAAIFHDIGKVNEISFFPENDYTDTGNLLGHIYLGAEMVGKKMDEMGTFSEVEKNQLKHCILAHHGELEFGSPKKPALVEALALSMADNLDAKMESMKELFAGCEPASYEWLGYQKLFESNIRRTK